MTGCTITGNTGPGGAGIANENDGATTTLTNCTITGNTSSQSGGGVDNSNLGSNGSGTTTLTNCTITGNAAPSGGGIYNYIYGGTIALTNCVVYGNTGGELANSSGVPTVSFCDIQGGYVGTGDINADPLFLSLSRGDLHLKRGSPCLGAGMAANAPTTAEDGALRPNPPSIGAYEAAPTPSASDFLVSSSSTAPNAVDEYTADGHYVQTIPWPANTGSYSQYNTEYLRGIAVTDAGDVVGFNGTFSPELDTFYPNTRAFVSRTAPGWKVSNNVSNGSIGVYQGYTFVLTEFFDSGDPPSAIIRFNPDGTSQEFAVAAAYTPAYINLTVGLDGKLYALQTNLGNNSEAYYVDVFDPVSLQKLRTVPLQIPFAYGSSSTDLRCLTVDAQGGIYTADLYNYVYHLDANGNLLQSATHAQNGYTTDIKMDPSGRRLLISISGYVTQVLQTDLALTSFQLLVQSAPSQDNSAFLAFSNAKLAAALNNPASTTHVLWNNPDGRTILWAVDGAGGVTYHAFGPYTDGSPGTPWTAKALSTGPDGLSHILWTNPDGHVILWNVDTTFHFTSHTFGPYTDGSPSTPWSAVAVSAGP